MYEDLHRVYQHLYQSIGQYLEPKINLKQKTVTCAPSVNYPTGQQYAIHEGTCQDTGIAGPVIDYQAVGEEIPTSIDVLWLKFGQKIRKSENAKKLAIKKKRPDRIKDPRVGGGKARHVFLIGRTREIYGSVDFEMRIPHYHFQTFNNILRKIVQEKLDNFLFISFTPSYQKVLSSPMRWSSYPNLEINGELKISETALENEGVNLENIAECLSKESQVPVAKMSNMRFFIRKTERNDREQEIVEEIINEYPALESLLSTLYKMSDIEFGLLRAARDLEEKEDDDE